MVIGAAFVVFLLALVLYPVVSWLWPALCQAKVESDGVDAVATVMQASWAQNNYVNGRPLISFRLRVQPADGPSFVTDADIAPSPLRIPHIGERVAVRYDPANPSNLLFTDGVSR